MSLIQLFPDRTGELNISMLFISVKISSCFSCWGETWLIKATGESLAAASSISFLMQEVSTPTLDFKARKTEWRWLLA